MNETVRRLLSGNTDHARAYEDRFGAVQDGQRPAAVSVCCSDSRVLQDHIWENDQPGQLFTVGNIGNRVIQHTAGGEAVSGDVLYPIAHAGTETVVVVGHTACGAVTATYDATTAEVREPPGIDHCVSLLGPHLQPGIDLLPDSIGRSAAINRLVEYNVDQQIALLRESEAVPDTVDVLGVVYDFQDVYDGRRGEVHVVNVDGVREQATLRAEYPEIAHRVQRLWTP